MHPENDMAVLWQQAVHDNARTVSDRVISPSDEKRALQMYELALSLVEAKGTLVPVGFGTVMEYRTERMTIHYLPKSGHMDLWSGRKVLMIERRSGSVHVTRYIPGDWEPELEALVAKSPSKD
jgi:hypothetical protein